MLEFTPITFDDGKKIKRICKTHLNALSSHAFQSLWLWQKEMGLNGFVGDGFFAVESKMKGSEGYFFPCGEKDSVKSFLENFLKSGDKLLYLTNSDKDFLCESYGGQYKFTRAEYADEYIYDIDAHIALKGGKYANMRTQVHRVENGFNPVSKKLCRENMDDAIKIIRNWEHGEHRFEGHSIRDDEVDENAINFMEELEIEGIIVYLDSKPMALAAGFAISEDTFDIAVSKCCENLQGVSYYSKRELLKMLQGRYKYMNMEEDLGISGLRKMKESLRPIRKNEMWEAIKL